MKIMFLGGKNHLVTEQNHMNGVVEIVIHLPLPTQTPDHGSTETTGRIPLSAEKRPERAPHAVAEIHARHQPPIHPDVPSRHRDHVTETVRVPQKLRTEKGSDMVHGI